MVEIGRGSWITAKNDSQGYSAAPGANRRKVLMSSALTTSICSGVGRSLGSRTTAGRLSGPGSAIVGTSRCKRASGTTFLQARLRHDVLQARLWHDIEVRHHGGLICCGDLGEPRPCERRRQARRRGRDGDRLGPRHHDARVVVLRDGQRHVSLLLGNGLNRLRWRENALRADCNVGQRGHVRRQRPGIRRRQLPMFPAGAVLPFAAVRTPCC